MKDNLALPPGTSVMICRSSLILSLEWEGLAGRHVIQLSQSLDWEGDSERDDAIANAAALFRNAVGLEVMDDALSSGEIPISEDEYKNKVMDSPRRDMGG